VPGKVFVNLKKCSIIVDTVWIDASAGWGVKEDYDSKDFVVRLKHHIKNMQVGV